MNTYHQKWSKDFLYQKYQTRVEYSFLKMQIPALSDESHNFS